MTPRSRALDWSLLRRAEVPPQKPQDRADYQHDADERRPQAAEVEVGSAAGVAHGPSLSPDMKKPAVPYT